jgi:predicted DCC family thiol-disulfide oxidoreductase YuxK
MMRAFLRRSVAYLREALTKRPRAATVQCSTVAASGRRSVRATYPVLFIFDGQCGVCTRFVRILRNLDSLSRALHGRDRGSRVRMVPYQKPGVTQSTGLSLEDCRASAWAVSVDGERYRGAEAVNVVIGCAIGTRIPHILYKLPLIRGLQDLAYGWIAANRRKLPGDKPYCSQYPSKCQSD